MPLAVWPKFTQAELRDLIERWEPPVRPHCSDCSHARVGGRSDDPTVTCRMGHGHALSLVAMIRRSHPRQFVPAVRCPDFDSMGGPA